MDFDVVVAYDSRRGIGKNGKIPWNLKGDLKHFRDLTTAVESIDIKSTAASTTTPASNAVIMGRRTWDSIAALGRAPLKGRDNFVITSMPISDLRVNSVGNIDEAIKLIDEKRDLFYRAFIIGGSKVYREALNDARCRRIYATEIEGDFECDIFFPEAPGFKLVSKLSDDDYLEENGIKYRFVKYER